MALESSTAIVYTRNLLEILKLVLNKISWQGYEEMLTAQSLSFSIFLQPSAFTNCNCTHQP